MTTKANLHLYRRPNVDLQAWPVDPNQLTTINAESFVYYNTSLQFLVPLVSDANGANFVGLCLGQEPVAINGTAFQQGGGPVSSDTDNLAIVSRFGQAHMFVTSGQLYVPGMALYIGADAQTVTNVVGSHQIGYVSGDQAPILSATAGTKVHVDYRAQYPALAVN